ncbi:group II truncated hemoglobin [Sutterella sp.]|uniref:group II truncated hemoglobin n=1 Tax=Sutterella sp. TaxID=1981025 RepID=UPI0026DF7EC6|nr:group II truncated hemoglobin [Sutterella sp.]MDO5530475.1 group II truncated hemoglobin [Sutterella sp.]
MQDRTTTLYSAIGGEEGVRRLVRASVRILREDPSVEHLRALYKPGRLEGYECRLQEFLSGWLGGPAVYHERHGLPMLRERHRSLPISEELMREWIRVMRTALAETVPDAALRLRLEGAFTRMAESLVNVH